MIEIIIVITYTFWSLANNKVGIKIAARIMIPPIVGVPDFSSCPDNPKSRTVSPIC